MKDLLIIKEALTCYLRVLGELQDHYPKSIEGYRRKAQRVARVLAVIEKERTKGKGRVVDN